MRLQPLHFTASRSIFTSEPHAGQDSIASRLILRGEARFWRRAFVIRFLAVRGKKVSASVTAVRFTELAGDSRGEAMRLITRGSLNWRGERSRISMLMWPSHSYSIQKRSGTERWKRANQGLYS